MPTRLTAVPYGSSVNCVGKKNLRKGLTVNGKISPPEHRVKVYRFGAVWFWKCKLPAHRCGHGGRFRSWGDAVERAMLHANMRGTEEG